MCADPARAGACAALARRRRAAPSSAFERTSDARTPRAACAVPQVLRVVRSRLGRVERGPAAGEGSFARGARRAKDPSRSEEHTSELQSPYELVCRLLLDKKKR